MSVKLTLDFGENDNGWWYTVVDGAGEPYAGGSASTFEDAWHYAFPYSHDIATEIPLEMPSPEEYAEAVARSKAGPQHEWKM